LKCSKGKVFATDEHLLRKAFLVKEISGRKLQLGKDY
jgi:hypothetical protein